MSNLLKFLMLVLCPAVTDDPEEPEIVDPEDDPEPEIDPEDPEPEDPEDDPEPEEKPLSRREREMISLRERAQKAEEQHRVAMAELEAARKAPQGQQQPTEEQKLWEREEEILRDPKAEDWQRYSIQSARDARSARAESNNALRTAHDLADKADFMTLASLKPKTYDKYKDRVEEAKKKFPNAPRKELLKYLIGEDALSGNIKTEAKTTKKPGGAERGKLPGARSDSKGSGRLSDAEKRAKRLENVRI